MLHEILLSLSGHPSALFDAKEGASATDRSIDFPLLSPPEQELLRTIGRLSRLHRDLRDHSARISSSHPSTICRAVATSVSTVQLGKFQNKILDVESKILSRDTTTVGAYNIVPLAGVVGEFDEWTRRLEWFWRLVCFIQPVKPAKEPVCTGATIIDRLRQEAQTGYPDIEEVALQLGKVAETAWLRQLSTWVLYGRLPLVGAQDFFIRNEGEEIEMVSSLLPKFVSGETAASILFIGKSLNTIRERRTQQEHGRVASETELVPVHLQHLAQLAFPLSSSALSNAIGAIRLSLSRNTLQQLLPLPSILQILTVLRDFFLLRRGEFAVSLVYEADACIRARTRSTSSKATESLRGILIKDVELSMVLTKTLTTLSSKVEDDHDTSLDFARSVLRLQTAKPTSTRPSTPGRAKAPENLPQLASASFNDFLLPSPTALTLDIAAPFDLFLTQAELNIYTALQSYLLSLRRAHLRLSSLWRQTPLRRSHPTPLGPPASCKPYAAKVFSVRRDRAAKRNTEMRAVWATCFAAVFLLSEIGNYFEGEVIDTAWAHLRRWITQEPESRSKDSSRPGTSHSRPTSKQSIDSNLTDPMNKLNIDSQDSPAPAPHDPAVLTSSHRRFLTFLCRSLLLTDTAFTTALHTLLQNIDAVYSFVVRLQTLQENLDLEEDEGVVDPMASFAKEEEEVKRDLGRARKKVDAGLREIVGRLRVIDTEGGVNGPESDDLDEASAIAREGEEGVYMPLRSAGVERLLMRLEGGRRGGEGNDEDNDGIYD